jgi:hypothetical protein
MEKELGVRCRRRPRMLSQERPAGAMEHDRNRMSVPYRCASGSAPTASNHGDVDRGGVRQRGWQGGTGVLGR